MTRHRSQTTTSSDSSRARSALLLARQLPNQSNDQVHSSLLELSRLVEGLGLQVAGTVVQKRSGGGGVQVLGKGKRAEVLAQLVALQGDGSEPAPLVVVDGSLSPGQLRLLQNELEVEVVDRTDIILRVFAQRARTGTAHLEVELAQLRYQAPRLRDEDDGDDREGGGGRGERGHTNVELRKQRIRERMAAVERELLRLRPLRERQRVQRRELPAVALVGYTNAGKSSLMRGLTGSDVLVKDQLFATLGTTVRALQPSTTPRILVTDTVGFIKNLPHELISSFRSTLDEARDADLLLFVVDAADPQWAAQLDVTRATIAAIGPEAPPALVVFNKIDRVDAPARALLARDFPQAVQVNAYDPADLRRLRQAIIGVFEARMEVRELAVPVRDGRLLADIKARGQVQQETFDEAGQVLRLRLRALPEALEDWRRLLGGAGEEAGRLAPVLR